MMFIVADMFNYCHHSTPALVCFSYNAAGSDRALIVSTPVQNSHVLPLKMVEAIWKYYRMWAVTHNLYCVCLLALTLLHSDYVCTYSYSNTYTHM